MKLMHTDALIIGGGLAGQRAAIGVRRRGLDALILSLVPARRSHSVAAQGGMQASLGHCAKGEGDNEDVHFEDTVRGSDWGCDQIVARMFAHMAPKAAREMAAWGVPWNRVRRGEHQVVINGEHVSLVERDAAHGLITARDFGGTRKWRTCHTSDGTGHALLYAVSDRVIAESIPVHDRKEALALILDGGRCHGAVVRDLVSGELAAYLAGATVIATGGYGRIYGVSTNALINEGMGAALALETGVARLGNMEAVQFHPTAIVPAGILVTEGCRGDGGLLKDVDGYRFMPDYEPDKKELASRDVVSRRMAEHMRRGKGVRSPYGEHLWLDITGLGADHIDRNLREVKDICQYFLGIDPARDYIPVRPTQHYSMGGVRTDHSGQSPWLAGLFSCGEAACWDMHGFNRLGGNSLAETLVAGMLVGESVADYCASAEAEAGCPTALAREFLEREQAELAAIASGRGNEEAVTLRRRMETVMTDSVGLFRNGPALAAAVDELADLLRRSRHLGMRCRRLDANPELVQAYRLPRMLKVALTVALGALRRTESRGAHFREDFPARDDRHWLNRTLASWRPGDELPTLDYEVLDVMHMELPPGFRGYGVKNIIDHPLTAARQSEVDELREARLDRHALQSHLMAFKQFLPERYRGRNARLDEPLP
ncbi:MAG: fumarate reductase flavoprotein subunit [bacterium]|nr:MAG: fumarate reductase flavoprotein subunit [bacterium]KAF0148771.1 MAG: fumarate reductase flavoprotein subunit [bacterium]KAF0167367.1 MAG: fumarate reductase flavoprotein subunit [bacterium]TXT20222.1 MAG: fumarate reductase flavoprotein subunit [bacterium]